jgi:hypothetical protein
MESLLLVVRAGSYQITLRSAVPSLPSSRGLLENNEWLHKDIAADDAETRLCGVGCN